MFQNLHVKIARTTDMITLYFDAWLVAKKRWKVKPLPPAAVVSAKHITKKVIKKTRAISTRPLCPVCETVLRLSRVNVSRCTRVGGNWKTVAVCRNSKCRYTELSIKLLKEW